MQLNHNHVTTKFVKRKFPITLVCDHVTNAPNIGSLFRIADAFGIEQLLFCGDTIHLGRKMTKTARATEKVVDHEINKDIFKVIEDFKSKDYQIIALEITDTSTPIHKFQLTNTKRPIVLVIGDENFGIEDNILKTADTILHIDMFGQNSSMNVVQAANIAIYELTKQLM